MMLRGRALLVRQQFPLQRALLSSSSQPQHLSVERRGAVGLITLNRPKALNALCNALIVELCDAAEDLDRDSSIGALVITGSGGKAFAAGADIKEMSSFTFAECYMEEKFGEWARLCSIRKPIIAAVNGYALGGGCELAMMCDIVLAGEKAKFGQPEINLGVIPGWGGTQRLVRAVGKSKAMEMILTGCMIDAKEAHMSGLVSRVYPDEELLPKALEMATTIADKSRPSVLMAKEAINAADNTTLTEGLRLERRLFHSLFSTEDQKEGMAAFAEKRTPLWKHK